MHLSSQTLELKINAVYSFYGCLDLEYETTSAKDLKTDGRGSARLTPVFVFQGSLLWGGPGWGEEDSEVSGHQVYPKEGFRRQGEQHREWDRRSAQVSQITDYRPGWDFIWNSTHQLQDCKFFMTVALAVQHACCVKLHVNHIYSTWSPGIYDRYCSNWTHTCVCVSKSYHLTPLRGCCSTPSITSLLSLCRESHKSIEQVSWLSGWFGFRYTYGFNYSPFSEQIHISNAAKSIGNRGLGENKNCLCLFFFFLMKTEVYCGCGTSNFEFEF